MHLKNRVNNALWNKAIKQAEEDIINQKKILRDMKQGLRTLKALKELGMLFPITK